MSHNNEFNNFTKFRHPGVKRLMLEAQEMRNNTEDFYYCAQPVEDNLFEWHFTLRGPRDTVFEGGVYHGRLSFPTDYPMKPPSIYLLTPNGRFETNKKICLSISGYHPETWQPSWSIRTALLALMGFMPSETNRAIGSLDYSDRERRELARKSRNWKCETCGPIKDLLKQDSASQSMTNRDINRLSSVNADYIERKETMSADISRTNDVLNLEQNSERDTSSPQNPSPDRLDDTSNQHIPNDINVEQSNAIQANTQDDQSISRNTTSIHRQNRMVFDEFGPSSGSLVLRSIFVLLLVLLFRRILMIAQVA